MTTSPGYMEPIPPMVGVATVGWSAMADRNFFSAAPSDQTVAASNLAHYYAIVIPTTCIVRRMWWANGSTVSASYNIDAGIYRDAGFQPVARLVSTGSTAQGTASQVQFVDVTDTTLPPGLYWLAITCSSGSATLFSTYPAPQAIGKTIGYEQFSALPLPSSATPITPAYGLIYLCGFAATASP